MLILALEHSTNDGSAALLRDGQIVSEAFWNDRATGCRLLVASVQRLLETANESLPDVDLYAVGIGPGAYTNLRTSLSTAQGWALPGRQPVRGICSAEALARDLSSDPATQKITIVGNARRKRLWIMQYQCTNREVIVRREMTLVSEQTLGDYLDAHETVASPDGPAIGEILQRALPASARLIEQRCLPRAAMVGQIAAEHPPSAAGTPAEPSLIRPIYLHPPVFVPPRNSPRHLSSGSPPGL